VFGREPQPAGLAEAAEQRLHHREGDQLSVADLRSDPNPRAPRNTLRVKLQQIIDTHEKCGRREGVPVSVGASCSTLGSNADPGHLHLKSHTPHQSHPLELITGRPIAEVARELGINEGTLGNWVNKQSSPQPPDVDVRKASTTLSAIC
jgi:hypothetical protein